jgi:hypothetical protein
MRRERRLANLRRMRRESVRVEVAIDELVLEGFPASERRAIGDALSAGLERLFGEADIRRSFRRDIELPVLPAGRVPLPDRSGPAAVGEGVARAVYAGLNAGVEGRKK